MTDPQPSTPTRSLLSRLPSLPHVSAGALSRIMEAEETKCSSGYDKPPWMFKGSALYQLHLVKSEIARACIPREFRLVEAFGYTLGGFFLASYTDSPVGTFDELVVIAGLVWRRPTSCAWAAKVLVSNEGACDHGRKVVGLPSRVAKFSKSTVGDIDQSFVSLKQKLETFPMYEKRDGFLNVIGLGNCFHKQEEVQVKVVEVHGPSAPDVSPINLTKREPFGNWMGPMIKMSLPSYSGHTEYNPDLLKYACEIECRVRPVQLAGVSVGEQNNSDQCEGRGDGEDVSASVMLSRPLLALHFSCMKMQVDAPVAVSHTSQQPSSAPL